MKKMMSIVRNQGNKKQIFWKKRALEGAANNEENLYEYEEYHDQPIDAD